MKGRFLPVSVLLFISVIISITLTACLCKHEFKDASCTIPKTCSLCEKTEGEPLGHNWEDATCTTSKICERCKEIDGEPLGHNWEDVTCTTPKTCVLCKETEGEPLGHNWAEATCTEPQTCNICQTIVGTPKSHNIESWETETAPTCLDVGTKTGICSECNSIFSETLEPTGHTPDEWVITKEATFDSSGEKSQICSICSVVIDTEEYDLTSHEKEQLYKSNCKYYSYKDISRNPSSYKGEYAKFTGEVIQVMRENIYGIIIYNLRVNVTAGRYSYSDTVYVTYYASEDEPYILEDDIITMYGKLDGEKTYESVLGASITIPAFDAEYIDVY